VFNGLASHKDDNLGGGKLSDASNENSDRQQETIQDFLYHHYEYKYRTNSANKKLNLRIPVNGKY